MKLPYPTTHLSALKWLINRGGTGVFEKNRQVLIAAGERAPVMRSTWNKLAAVDLVVFQQNRKRLSVTEAGKAIDLFAIQESEARYLE